ncbi:aspartyl/asparaginyl beta-hydroxylase domain-containing protein [Streptomyces sp. M19]
MPSLDPCPVFDPARFWFTDYLRESYPGSAPNSTRSPPGPRAACSGGGAPARPRPVGAGHVLRGGAPLRRRLRAVPGHRERDRGHPGGRGRRAGRGHAVVAVPGHAHPAALRRLQRAAPGPPRPDGPRRPRMRVGDRTLRWKEGECLVFDDSFEHEVWHEGTRPRVVLLLDVSHHALDPSVRDWVLSARSAFDDRITSAMRERGIERAELTDGTLRLTADRGVTSLVTRHLREVDASAVELRDGKARYEYR